MSIPIFNTCCSEEVSGTIPPTLDWVPPGSRGVRRNEGCPTFGFGVKIIKRRKFGAFWGYMEFLCDSCPTDRPVGWYETFTVTGSGTVDYCEYSGTAVYQYPDFEECTGTQTCNFPGFPEEVSDWCPDTGTPVEGWDSCTPTYGTEVVTYSGSTGSITYTHALTDEVTPAAVDASLAWVESGGPWSATDPGDWTGASGTGSAKFHDRRGACDQYYEREEMRLAVEFFPNTSCYPMHLCAGPFTVNLKVVFDMYAKGYTAASETFVGEHEELITLTVSDTTIPDASWRAWSDILEMIPDEGVRLQFNRLEFA